MRFKVNLITNAYYTSTTILNAILKTRKLHINIVNSIETFL